MWSFPLQPCRSGPFLTGQDLIKRLNSLFLKLWKPLFLSGIQNNFGELMPDSALAIWIPALCNGAKNMSSFFSAYFVITVVSNHFSDYRYGYLFTGIIETYHRYWVQYLFLSLQYRYSLMVANLNFLAEKQYFNHENSLIDLRLLLLSPRSVPCLPCHSQNSYFCVIAALTLRWCWWWYRYHGDKNFLWHVG